MTTRRHFIKATAAALPALPGQAFAQTEKVDPYADGVLIDGAPALPEEGSFTFAVLPDTQNYSEKYPETYVAQTEWIVAQRESRRIAGVFHLGDITNRNTPEQWENARRAMKVLHDAKIPVCMVPGNHDYSKGGGATDRTTLLNDYFPAADAKQRPCWGGNYDKEPDRMENNFQIIEAADRKFLILGLEFGPRADVLRWANDVAAAHTGHEIILLTHAFIYFDDTRYDWKKHGQKQSWNPHDYGVAKNSGDDVSDGEEIWNGLICKHRNFILTLNGHVLGDGLGRIVTAAPDGRAIPQVLVNYQMRPKGGDGWLRLIEMRRDGTARTRDYSPTRNQRNESPQNQFDLTLPPLGGK